MTTEEQRRKALDELVRLTEEIRSQDPELFDANEHWINNPLIKPVSKVAMFEDWEAVVRKEEREAVIAELTAELVAIQEVGEEESYCEGLRHAVYFLQGDANDE